MDQIIREVTEIELDTNTINKEDGFFLSRSWKPCVLARKEHSRILPSMWCTLHFILPLPMVLVWTFLSSCTLRLAL
jgi:hypothetical protein